MDTLVNKMFLSPKKFFHLIASKLSLIPVSGELNALKSKEKIAPSRVIF
jgi:hypothetical protein